MDPNNKVLELNDTSASNLVSIENSFSAVTSQKVAFEYKVMYKRPEPYSSDLNDASYTVINLGTYNNGPIGIRVRERKSGNTGGISMVAAKNADGSTYSVLKNSMELNKWYKIKVIYSLNGGTPQVQYYVDDQLVSAADNTVIGVPASFDRIRLATTAGRLQSILVDDIAVTWIQ